ERELDPLELVQPPKQRVSHAERRDPEDAAVDRRVRLAPEEGLDLVRLRSSEEALAVEPCRGERSRESTGIPEISALPPSEREEGADRHGTLFVRARRERRPERVQRMERMKHRRAKRDLSLTSMPEARHEGVERLRRDLG